MTWNWSHSPEAYANAYAHVRAQDREWLAVVFAEWRAARGGQRCSEPTLNAEAYERELLFARDPINRSEQDLADFIVRKMTEQAHCTSGGHEAHACPFGCVPHLVSFDPDESEKTV